MFLAVLIILIFYLAWLEDPILVVPLWAGLLFLGLIWLFFKTLALLWNLLWRLLGWKKTKTPANKRPRWQRLLLKAVAGFLRICLVLIVFLVFLNIHLS